MLCILSNVNPACFDLSALGSPTVKVFVQSEESVQVYHF